VNLSNVANEALDLLKSARIDQAQVQVGISEIQELELTGKEVNLCRTNNDFGIRIKAVHHHKQATVSVNRWNEESKEKMLFDLKTGLEASEEDAAFGIYDSKAEQEFKSPRIQNDLGQALESLKEFSELVQKEYPSVGLRSLPFKSVQSEVILANSNGLRLYQEDSYYDYFVMFSAQDGNRTGSLNYIGNKTKSIPKNFMDPVGLRDLLKGSALELDAVALNEEIKGDVIYFEPAFNLVTDFKEQFV
jgi:predicted Zn-dependent protease